MKETNKNMKKTNKDMMELEMTTIGSTQKEDLTGDYY